MQEKRFLSITGILIVLLGVPSVWSVVREPKPVVTKEDLAKSSLASASAKTRSPASTMKTFDQLQAAAAAKEVSHRNVIQSKSVVMEYDCKKAGDLEVDGTLLRLKGQDSSCLNDKWTNISITNQSNGFTASVIFLKKGFTTDFIDLQEGDNNLEIQAKDDKGQSIIKKIVVKRRSIASIEGSR